MEVTQVNGVDRFTPFTEDELGTLKDKAGMEVVAVYIGGPYFAGNPATKEYIALIEGKGLGWIPIYVGQNYVKGSPEPVLTVEQGEQDALHAVALFDALGYANNGKYPIFLDLEITTYNFNKEAMGLYVSTWLKTVKSHGIREGLYGSIDTADYLIRLHEPPELFWLASWVSATIDSKLKLEDMQGVPPSLFINHQRGWQYAGNTGISGIAGKVDIDLFDKEYVIYKETPVAETVTDTETTPKEPVTEGVNWQYKYNQLRAEVMAFARGI